MITRSPLLRRPVANLTGVATALVAALAASNCIAKVPQLTVTPQSDLRFGSLVVFGSGSRTVSANGNVLDSGIMSGDQGISGPARFTVSYDRGNESRRPLDVQIEVVLSNVSPINRDGTSARIATFDSDLPGGNQIQPGRPFTIRIPDCRQRVCSRSFAVGGRLDVTRNFGGADLRFPLVLDAVVISTR
ncbi:MAG: DUF4402 domain-containing protein [Novosphingobium sp.]|uniref:DUF4402 domain-containing protein n=1 Tax=Novosphingobium sp. TaxID=1874826 RepID=UPI00262454EF|nr:DUF4402 domain-containing protein [Novosphingobium sp.]MCP5386260.1 DUF4402 domain-containing protein [Novosphingobium sp.]